MFPKASMGDPDWLSLGTVIIIGPLTMGKKVWWVEFCLQKTDSSPNSWHHENLTLFGNRVFADVIKLRRGRTGSEWSLIQWPVHLYEGNLDTDIHTQGEYHVMNEAEIKQMHLQTKAFLWVSALSAFYFSHFKARWQLSIQWIFILISRKPHLLCFVVM